ncbi:MAG: hypothetical protein VX777_04600 [Chlamydiota bacterium]|nr:hypothetical protein [Chlamydiota bacterium]
MMYHSILNISLFFSCLTLASPAFLDADCQCSPKSCECKSEQQCKKGHQYSKKKKRCSSRVTCYQKGCVRDDFGDDPAASWPSRRDGELSDQLGMQ